MDPFSVAASIAGLLSLAGSVVSTGYVLLSKLKKRATEIEALIDEMAGFSGILVAVQAYCANKDAATAAMDSLMAGDDGVDFQEALRACKVILEESKALLDAASRDKGLRALVKGDATKAQAEKLLARIERYKGFFILCLQLQHSLRYEKTEKAAEEMVSRLRDIQSGQDYLKKRLDEQEMRKKRNKILEWLGPTTEAEHNDICKRRDADSAQWILDREEFTNWLLCESSSYFWLQGIQGSGKSVIASKVIETIQAVCLDERTAIAYYYCRYSDSSTDSTERLIGALVSQAFEQLDAADAAAASASSLLALFDKYQSKSIYPSVEELQVVWSELCQSFTRVFLVIDGLDQLGDSHRITDFLDGLSDLGVDFKTFVASRSSLALEQAFAYYSTVVITATDITGDIEQHVRSRLHQLRIDSDPEVDDLIHKLVARADGMFLWVACQLDHLSRVRTAISPDLIKALPRGLDQTFEAVLLKLDDEDRVLALELLRCIVYADRPLEPEELAEAVAVQPKMSTLAQVRKNKLRRPSDILDICGSLVRQSKSTGKLALAHFSVFEFLSSPQLERGRKNDFFLERISSSLNMVTISLTYLSLEDFGSATFDDKIKSALDMGEDDYSPGISAHSAFLEYAATSWWQHVTGLVREDLEVVWPLLKSFFDPRQGNFETWGSIMRYLQGGYKYPVGIHPIHVAALHDLRTLAALLLDDDPSCITSVTADGRTPLHIALESGSNDLADLLLDKGAAAGELDNNGQSPLHIAIQAGDALSVIRLVEAGADVNATLPGESGTPLSIAIENNLDGLADFLCGMADKKHRLEDGRSLLHVAGQSGSLAWAVPLIELHKNDLDLSDQNHWTALHYAADNGHEGVVLKLLESGASPAPVDEHGWTPLHAAIRRRHLQCAKPILQWLAKPTIGKQVDRTRRGIGRRTARAAGTEDDAGPSTASSSHRGSTNRARGKYGLDYDSSRSSSAPSPVLVAVSDSYVEGVQLLLQNGNLSLDRAMGFYDMGTCLQRAVNLQDGRILELLLPAASTADSRPVFHDLIKTKSPAVATWLRQSFSGEHARKLLREALVTNEDVESGRLIIETWQMRGAENTRLFTDLLKEILAKPKCKIELIRFALANSASLYGEDVARDPPLCVALRNGNFHAAEFLLERLPTIEQQSSHGETALLALARSPPLSFGKTVNATACADFLLSKGADLAATDDFGLGFCHKAVEGENAALLEWALDRGVAAEKADYSGITPAVRAVIKQSTHSLQILLTSLARDPRNVLTMFQATSTTASPFVTAVELKNPALLCILVEAEEKAFNSLPQVEEQMEARHVLYTDALCQAMIQGVRRHDWEIVEPLLSRVPDVSRADASGQTPLHIAARHGAKEAVQAVLDKGADINSKLPESGDTACDVALQLKHSAVVRTLVDHGAPIRPEYLSSALEWEDRELLASLLQRGCNLEPEHLSQAARATNPDLVVGLIEQGAPVSREHLFLAAEKNHVALLEIALATFSDDSIDHRDALKKARDSGSRQAASCLALRLGLRDHVRHLPQDTQGGTVLHSALRRKSTEDVMLIVECCWDDEDFLLTRDEEGQMALTWAISNADWVSTRMLMRTGVGTEEAYALAASRGVPKELLTSAKLL